MPRKATASKKSSQQLKSNSKRRAGDENLELSEKEVRDRAKRKKNHPNALSVEEQTKHINLKQMKIASNKRSTWQPLSESTKELLQSMIESIIIAILSNSKEKEKIQYHLNYLKKRLLQLCETLKVPPKKLKSLTNVSELLKMERGQDRANEESLALLQEEIDKMVETTESMTTKIQTLEKSIQILANEVEEEEEKLKQIAQVDSNSILSLPELSQDSLRAPVLQEEILTLIPNQSALLKDLNILHNSPHMQNLSMFIEEAYKKLDTS